MSEDLPQRIAVGLTKIGLALRQQSWQEAGGRGMSPTQGQILATLAGSGALRPGEVAARLAISAPTVSDSVRVLESKGLLERIGDSRDARATLLRLTTKGRREAARASGWPDFLASAVDAMSSQEQAVFLSGLVKMIRTLQDRGQIPVSRMCVSCTHFQPNVHSDPAGPHHCSFVDAPLAADQLRLDCSDHDQADDAAAAVLWASFIAAVR